MTKKESERALELYNEVDNLLWFHNKNLTQKQYYLVDEVREFLRDISKKAYEQSKRGF